MKPRFHHLLLTHTMWLSNSSPSSWYRSKKVKAKAILCILCTPMSISEIHLSQNLRQPSLTVIISQRTMGKFVEIHMKVLKLWSAIFHKFFGQHFKQDHHSLQMVDHFALHREHLFTHFWTFYVITSKASQRKGESVLPYWDFLNYHRCYYTFQKQMSYMKYGKMRLRSLGFNV
jgi:hypothetical protein